MDLFRKIGIGVAMIIPTFVFCGLIYSLLHSWWLVFLMMIIMAVIYGLIISGKFARSPQTS
jgi:hypothetical protein